MDDVVVMARNKKEAIQKLQQIREFLTTNLKLELNSKTQIFKSSQGVNFCGYKINEYRLKIRTKGRRFTHDAKQHSESRLLTGLEGL